MSKIEEAIETLNSCADALDEIPVSLLRRDLFWGPYVKPSVLREEAKNLDMILKLTKGE